ncbi:phosphonate metabolism transcriptional regulator PhnF [Gymnodinialimonas sp. 57CJ19]|uniref:phosphonate metabolism transcriptional regulator PhnF n=1 Tax=Gymnodinialimonas sp. 57CJ19 TaxID=3138498 RepID=UPI0031342CEC
MGRIPIWTAIHDTLVEEIAAGHFPPGARLPTEAQLADRFGVNRHTVRRALAALADRDIVFSRRGAGVFVRHTPTPYPIGRRVRFHQNLLDANRVPDRRVLHLETRTATLDEVEALDLGGTPLIHISEGIIRSDDVTVGAFRSVFPAARFPDFLEIMRETRSVTKTFAAHGVTDYTRARTEVTAQVATKSRADLLEIRPRDPILRTISINVDHEGVPIEFGRAWFAADKVTLTVTDTEPRGF